MTDVSAVIAMVVYRADEFRQVGDALLRQLECPILLTSAVGAVYLATILGVYNAVYHSVPDVMVRPWKAGDYLRNR